MNLSRPKDLGGKALVENGWAKVMADRARRFPSKLVAGEPRLIEYAWHHFDAKHVLHLLGNEGHYNGHHRILFAGLCAWIICQGDEWLRQESMLRAGIAEMCWAEALGKGAFASELLGETTGRLLYLGPDFYADFYHPVGGLARLVDALPAGELADRLFERSAEVETIVLLMQLFHFHADHLRRPGFNKASLKKAAELTRAIFRDGPRKKVEGAVGFDEARERWGLLNGTAALVYAASSLVLEDGRTLLAAIRNSEATWKDHGALLPRWLARAQYATNGILAHLWEPAPAALHAAYLPPIKPEPIEPPAFHSEEVTQITHAFDRKRLLKGLGR